MDAAAGRADRGPWVDAAPVEAGGLDRAAVDAFAPDRPLPEVWPDVRPGERPGEDARAADSHSFDPVPVDAGPADLIPVDGAAAVDAALPALDHLLGYACTQGAQGRPLGGGEGYGAWLPASGPQVTVVDDKEGLLAALATAQAGDIVYVDDGAVIDLGSEVNREIALREGVTLASGRGRDGSLGALLYTEQHDQLTFAAIALFKVTGPRVRVSGLRLRGPDLQIGTTAASPMAQAVRTAFSSTLQPLAVEVDNCEFYGWPNAAVSVSGTDQAWVHHNFFHHNRRAGFGYGVVVNSAFPVIGANVFDHNRHAIAATGYPATSYEACHNLVLANATSTSFDMHGGFDKGFYPDTAGSTLLIHHNTFLAAHVDGIGVRGVPDTLARVEDNRFVHPPTHVEPSAIWQRFWLAAPACLYTGGCVVSEWVDHPGYLRMADAAVCRTACSPSLKVRDPDGLTAIRCARNTFGLAPPRAWYAALGGTSYWAFREFSELPLADLLLGDLDGDGRTDGLIVEADTWRMFPGLKLPARTINSSQADRADLALADLDGDDRADVLGWR